MHSECGGAAYVTTYHTGFKISDQVQRTAVLSLIIYYISDTNSAHDLEHLVLVIPTVMHGLVNMSNLAIAGLDVVKHPHGKGICESGDNL